MAACPIPSCGAKFARKDSGGYCGVCGNPEQPCLRCGSINRSLAQCCRSCSTPFPNEALQAEACSPTREKWDSPQKHLVTQEHFWVAPLAHAGWLWFLSIEGQLSRYSPGAGSMIPVIHLGEEYGRAAPMARVRMPAGSRWRQPGLAMLAPGGVAVVGMIDGRKTGIPLEDGETAIADFMTEPCGVAGGDHEVCFFVRRYGQVSLALASLTTNRVERRIEVNASRLAGPFRCGSHIFAYSEAHLYTYSGGEWITGAFPAGFRPSIQGPDPLLRQTFGRLPCIVNDEAIYIPGRQADRPVFLFQRPHNGPAIIPIQGEAMYSADASERPVLAEDGKIATLEGSVYRVVREDAQLSTRGPAYAAGGTAVALAAPSPTAFRLRLFQPGGTADFSVRAETFRECAGLYALGNTLTYCEIRRDTTLGLCSWIC